MPIPQSAMNMVRSIGHGIETCERLGYQIHISISLPHLGILWVRHVLRPFVHYCIKQRAISSTFHRSFIFYFTIDTYALKFMHCLFQKPCHLYEADTFDHKDIAQPELRTIGD